MQVLATDNASHFEHLEQFEQLLDSCTHNAVGIDNQVVLNLMLHACDVANTTKVRRVQSTTALSFRIVVGPKLSRLHLDGLSLMVLRSARRYTFNGLCECWPNSSSKAMRSTPGAWKSRHRTREVLRKALVSGVLAVPRFAERVV